VLIFYKKEIVVVNKKYELTGETIRVRGDTLYRIKALRDFGNVKAGDLGGFVQSEKNLGHEGNCWLYGNSKVYQNAIVMDDAALFDNAIANCDALISGSVRMRDSSRASIQARVSGNVELLKNSVITHYAQATGAATLTDTSFVGGNAKVSGSNAIVSMRSVVKGDATVTKRVLGTNANRDYIALSDNHFTLAGDWDETYSIDYWLENLTELAKQRGYSDKEILGLSLVTNALLVQGKLRE
jgi:carbonic anhydrase/acetyltransferase-like protein (isoleucine patch superfamily)